ncbi:hypothetical protein [Streptomyces xinghaiensis]|uniref:hypothetical protein n=1 Tax=Streptomyces xinghaiensis TaxID=1038928 RepID=UPI002E113773|nr:hypothetical protein OG463_11765 [Streptomyces xinghaiensis]
MGAASTFRWVDATFPDAYVDGSGRSGIGVEGLALKERSESSHAHADYRIKNHQTSYDRIDAILALKRSMQTRLEHLDSLYGFKQYPEYKTIGWMGILEKWGVIRKRMLQRMRQLRNAVEHDGAEPPSLEECADYAEVTWWFLRGTSPLLAPLDMIDYSGAAYGTVRYSYNPLVIALRIDMGREMVSEEPQPGWSKIELVSPESAQGKWNRVPEGVSEAADICSVEGVVAEPESAHGFLRSAFSQLL